MLTMEIFRNRVTALWESQKRMAAPKKWHSGKRAGNVRKPAVPIRFTKGELEQWLWKKVGLNAIQCPYCTVPIDVLSLTLDHIQPRSTGGEFSLDNMHITCKDCNTMRGDMTHDAFLGVLAFSRTLSSHDRNKLLGKLKASHHGSPARFFRKPAPAITRPEDEKPF